MRFEDLEVWKRSARLATEIYKVTVEVRSQLYIGKEIGYLDAEFADASIKECKELSKMLAALIARRRKFADQAGDEPAEYTLSKLDHE